MGKITVGLGILASLIFYNLDRTLFWTTLVTTALTFWTLGIMHNYAYESAKAWKNRIIENKELEGASPEEIKRVKNLPIKITVEDTQQAPNGLTWLNMIFSFGIYLLLIIGIIKRFF
jgi:hypothetical protein